ncbi:hypothetical protein [Alkalihalobacillus deserti]|uniref:hypothetical protein n=1 Tax=Alkalihalobacillus deserti TaxID=2879466 RepID=UPI001D14F76E|nr:hypothetical protein [Alkalihalobacillus deserti]
MSVEFIYDSRLCLSLPSLHGSWKELNEKSQEQILAKWESIRGTIPDRIKEIEEEIETVHEQLTREEDFERSCELNLEMAELASAINDLWIWFRLTPSLTT